MYLTRYGTFAVYVRTSQRPHIAHYGCYTVNKVQLYGNIYDKV